MNVDELDAEARDLIAAGRDGTGPSELVRARVQRGVQAKLAAGMSVAAMSYSPAVLGAGAKTGALLAVVAAVATGGWYYGAGTAGEGDAAVAVQKPPRVVQAAPRPAKLVPVPAPGKQAEPPVDPKPEAQAPKAKSTGASKPSEAAKPSAQLGLADEIALLSKASAALNRGQTGRAAQLLAEYDRLGSKHLIEERSATGVLMLCRSGQVAAARAAAGRFFKRYPRSPLASRVQASCAGDSSHE